MRVLWVGVAALVAGCLFPDLSALDQGADASSPESGDAPASEAGDASDAGLCDPTETFATPSLLPGLDTLYASNGRLSLDETEIFFQIYGDGGVAAIVHATRPSAGSAFGAWTALASIDTAGNNWDAMLSADGVTLVFASTRSTEDIYSATRPSPSQDFGAPAPITAVDVTTVNKPYVQGLNVALWYESFATGNGDIYVAPSFDGSYNLGGVVPELSTAAEEDFPVVNAGATLIYFARSGLADAGGSANANIWFAQRATASDPWNPPSLVAELNTTADQNPTWLSPDLCRLYFSSDRSGVYELYVASRTP
jgi:hypothetical protein